MVPTSRGGARRGRRASRSNRLGVGAAEEEQRVAARAAVDVVVAVAGLPAEAVEVAAQVDDVVALVRP